MGFTEIPGTSLRVSPVAIGTWAIGGWMWGGTDEAESVATIRAAFEHGINLVDTAPVYGFGRSEEIVGKAIAESGLRSNVVIASKAGLQWENGKVSRNASRARIMREIEDSLRRLRTDYIDIYQVHWPDPLVTIEETADAMHMLFAQGKIRAIGFAALRRCTSCSHRTICSNVESRPTSCPIAGKTTSPCWDMARCAGASCPDE
jgi:aryl-alcohol dehydrogenase-like predicted oxidoreductase